MVLSGTVNLTRGRSGTYTLKDYPKGAHGTPGRFTRWSMEPSGRGEEPREYHENALGRGAIEPNTDACGRGKL